MTAPVLYVRDGSRFVPVDDARPAPWRVDVPPIPTPVPVPDGDEPRSVDALGRPGPSCGLHIASWAAYTDATGRPACKLCAQTPRRSRHAR